VSEQSSRADAPAVAWPDVARPKPGLLARVLATTIVSSAVGAVAVKLLGRKAGFVAFLLSASAHELLDAPLARLLRKVGV
jgi:hypothetical protein